MKGITQKELQEIKEINLIDYIKETDPSHFRERDNGTLVYLADKALVIYPDHGYYFEKVAHSYMDNIATLRFVYGYSFMDAIDHLKEYRDGKEPLPFLQIPDGIDDLID